MPSKTLPLLPCACANVRRAARAITHVYDEALRDTGLRSTQFTLLQALQASPCLSQRELGEILCMDSTSLTRTLRPLIDRDWIAWQRGEDKRQRLLSLTETGVKKLAEVVPSWQKAQLRFKKALSSDPNELDRTLRQIASALS